MKGFRLIQKKALVALWVCSSLSLLSTPVHAEVLCHRTKLTQDPTQVALQVFKEACPRGFTPLSASALGVGKLFSKGLDGSEGPKGATGIAGQAGAKGEIGLQGDVGPQGATGPKGIAGPEGQAGAKGDRGATGDVGANGRNGVAGPQGLQGEPGPKGAVGDAGPQGFSASELFSFIGGTGNLVLGNLGEAQVFPIGQSGGPTAVFANAHDLMVPIGSTCSSIEFVGTVENAPGGNNTWDFQLLTGDYSTAPQRVPLCTITGPLFFGRTVYQRDLSDPGHQWVR